MAVLALSRVVFWCSFCSTIAHLVYVVSTGLDGYPSYLPDDAFYYLQMAKSAAQGQWFTFDSGQTVNTGFHLLWFYLLVVIAWLTSGSDTHLVAYAIVLSGSLCSITALLAYREVKRDAMSVLMLSLFVAGYAFQNGFVSVMEWPLCIMISASVFYLFLRAPLARANVLGGLFVLGLLGVLSRSDFIGFALIALLSACLLVLWLRDTEYVRPAAMLFCGAVIGYLLVALHSFLIVGDWMQSSARMKLAWGKFVPIDPIVPAYQFVRSFLYLPPLSDMHLREQLLNLLKPWFPLVVLVMGGVLVWGVIYSRKRVVAAGDSLIGNSRLRYCSVVSVATLAGYWLVYSRNAIGMQSWYSAHVFIPMLFIAVLSVHCLPSSIRTNGRHFLAAAVATVVLSNLAIFALTAPTYEGQQHLRRTGVILGQLLKAGDVQTPIGISDAGIVGFYSGGRIINTDGLVNSEIHHYFPGRLACYVQEKKFKWMSGFGWVSDKKIAPLPWNRFSTQVKLYGRPGDGAILLRKIDQNRLKSLGICR